MSNFFFFIAATRLVSYGADDIDEDLDEADEEKSLEEKYDVSSIEMHNVAKVINHSF